MGRLKTNNFPVSETGDPAEETGDKRVYRVLWTGGWDSTYRVLALLSRKRCAVKPFYLLDPNRRSYGVELSRMRGIAAAVKSRGLPGRLEPLVIVSVRDVRSYTDIESSWHALNKVNSLGSQYMWLASFVRESNLGVFELCVEPGGKAWEHLVRCTSHVPPRGVFAPCTDIAPDDVMTLFHNMEFPVLGMSKAEMGIEASMWGFRDLLERSWFCHSPLRGVHPCGLCNPCRDALSHGVSYRVGWRGRWLNVLLGWSQRLGPRLLNRLGAYKPPLNME